MTPHAPLPTVDCSVRRVPLAAKPTLAHLLQLYLHDLSEFDAELQIRPDGSYAYDWFDRYWTDPERRPYTIHAPLHEQSSLAGFALVRVQDDVTHMAEFFVLREFRRKSLGAQAARDLFDVFPGPWEVRQVPRNLPAQAFWRRIIDGYTNGAYRESVAADGDIIQHFRSRGASTVTELS